MPLHNAHQDFEVSAWLRGIIKFAALILFLVPTCWAQLPPVSSTTMTPVPGAGHDYIHAPLESVNPVNGSVSIRIPVRLPSGRELTLPFSFAYDSAGVSYAARDRGVGNLFWLETTSTLSQAGWSETVPLSNVNDLSWTTTNEATKINCDASVDYVFQDAEGNRHNLGLTEYSDPGGTGPCTYNTADWPPGFEGQIVTQGGEGPIVATIPSNWTGGSPPTVTDGNGTVYSWAGHPSGTYMAASATDRNGNTITINSTVSSNPTFSYVDTAGRTILQDSGFALSPETLTVDGLSSPYTLAWTTLSTPTFATPITTLSGSCVPPTNGGWNSNSDNAVASITLPNGKTLSFSYDPVYSLVNKITYPTGGYIRYVWGMNDQAEYGYETDANGIATCQMYYAVPVITDRYVSFDGTTEVLHQHFAYSTTWDQSLKDTWDSKQTTVTTYDLVRGTNFQTVYTYSSRSVPNPPNTDDSPTNNVPVESSIAYYNTSGSLLRTVTKGWCNIRELCAVYTDLADTGQTSAVFNCYDINEQIIEKDEYDFGTGSQTSPACRGSVQFTGGPLLRTTKTAYASFSGANIVDLPSSVITYDGSGNRMAETDSSYDQTGLQSTSVTQHTAEMQRGNLTTVTKQCFVGSTACASGNSTTTYSYYDTGQIYQQTDPRGNITTYSYADSYSSCGGNAPPSGATNAYLTQVTFPQTNSVNHIVSYCYDYSAGLLRGSTDENGQVTTYQYNDPLDRLTATIYPDTGQTTVTYNDSAPSVQTCRKMNTSGQAVCSTTTMDGLGLAIKVVGINGAESDTTYDGLGRVYTATNPYFSTSDPTYGVTTYAYDALGRTTQVTHPDGSTIQTAYTGRATRVTDEGNGTKSVQRVSQTDGLGRMVSVCEVSSATQMGSSGTPAACGQDIGATGFLTSYGYDALGDLLSVTQGGLNGRSFAYDSLSRLTSASNPESGQTSYSYDANGNVSTKTDARGITTTYSYDALNRLFSKTYSDGTPSTSYTFDASSEWGATLTNPVGRLVLESADNGHAASVFSYDPMGRVANTWQCTAQDCGSGSFPLAYTYDLMGDPISSTNGLGTTFTYGYNAAAQLTSMTSSLSDANHPAALFSSPTYNALGVMTAATLGNGVTEALGYNSRGFLDSITDNGFGPKSASGSVSIGGSEQSIAGSPATSGTGSATVNGSEQTAQTAPATQATGTVTIDGSEQKICSDGSPGPRCVVGEYLIYDSGDVYVTVGGFLAGASYGEGSTYSSIVNSLTSQLNASNSPVTATSSGSTITLTSKATGTAANYSLSTSVSYDSTDFASPSFTATPSGSTLTGGKNATTTNDTGSVWVTVNGTQYSASYGSGSTTSSLASALASTINSNSTIVSASASGAGISLTATGTGASTNYSLSSGSSTSQPNYFSSPSFSVSVSGSSLTGGQNAGNVTYDSGTVWITINGSQTTVNYSQGSTTSSIASALASALNGSLVTASASGNVVNFTTVASGSSSNYSLSAGSQTNDSSQFSSASFSTSPSGSSLTGGSDNGTPSVVYSASLSYAPDGDVQTANDSVMGNWVYGYDDFNRLSTATGPNSAYNYKYDQFGNRWQQNLTSGSGQTSNLTFSGNNNRMDGYSYDAAGNLLNDGVHSYTYDAESRIVSVDGGATTYEYDAEGRRVRKTVGGGVTDYLYDLAGHAITELNGSGGWMRGEIYAGGRHIATYVNSTTYFDQADWLGTERARTAVNGTLCESVASLPFGDGMNTSGGCGDPSTHHFTGKMRDTETNLDDFDARYYSSQLGRFISSDWSSVPVPVPYANLTNPQTLNLYAIVSDNPETFADLDGHQKGCGEAVDNACPDTSGGAPGTTPQSGKGGTNPNNGKPSTTQNAQGANSQTQAAQQQNGQQGSQSKGPLPFLRPSSPAGRAAKALANREQQPPRGPKPPAETPNPTEPPPDVVPGANNPGVPIGTVPATTPEVNPTNLTTTQRYIYYGAQGLRIISRLLGGALNDFIIMLRPKPGQPGAPQPEA